MYEMLGPTKVGTYSTHLDTFAQMLFSQGFTNPTVLDIGAGSGIYAEYLMGFPGFSVTALDSSPDSLTLTHAEKLHVGINKIDLSRRFNGIHSIDAFGFDINPELFLSIVSRIITPSGILIISAVASASYVEQVDSSIKTRGFMPIRKSDWVPEQDERDWYRGRVRRKINYYVKT